MREVNGHRVHISIYLKSVPCIAGQLVMSGPCALPSGGAPLLDCDIIHRIQAALIPKPIPQTAEISGEGLHDKLDGTIFKINRCATHSRLRLPESVTVLKEKNTLKLSQKANK